MLHSISEVTAKIAAGQKLLLAGSESALSQLPKGDWIGGTIPYFMDANGGVCTDSQIFVTEVPACAAGIEIREYTAQTLPSICEDAPDNGYSFLILPAGSPVHGAYAENAPTYKDIFFKPVVGWVSGVHVSKIGMQPAKVFNGKSGKASAESALVMHVTLPADQRAELDIVNVFRPGPGDTISFPASGFSAKDCLVNGKPMNCAEYMAKARKDPQVPLIADYSGSYVNVSVQGVDEASGTVKFYAPVFAGVDYKFAAPVPDYVAAFESVTKNGTVAAFSCNCILNYLYAGLEGKKTGTITGPITFGEVAHQLLNQTLVRLFVRSNA